MCGIAGVVVAGPGSVPPDLLAALGAALAHRGPDGAGSWVSPDGRVGFAHRRLAIIDPDPRSDQPMRSADGAVTVTYNGEIYNHREVRSELERRGHVFRTASDTEVLVEALAAWGTGALPRLRGMFAFAAHDARSGEVILVRDALGIKPLHHVTLPSGDLVFASEVRALRPFVPAAIDPDAAIDLLLWGSIAAPRTSVAGIRALPAGGLLRIGGGRVEATRWAPEVPWSDDPGEGAADGSDIEHLVDAVRESVRAHLVADVPVAVFLSAGVDSGVITSIAATQGEVTALTVRDPDADESRTAAERARAIGVAHRIVEVPRDDATALAAAAIEALDQPSVDGVNSYVVARAAAQAGFRVALSGVGGDELFGGYPSASRLPTLARIHRALTPLGRLPSALLGRPAGIGWDRGGPTGRTRWILANAGLRQGPYLVVRGVFAPSEVAALLDVDLARVLDVAEARLAAIPVPPSSPAHPSASETTQYLRHQLLRDIDATSMASSVEVRTPLVDLPLLVAAAGTAERARTRGPAKAVLRAAARHDLGPMTAPKRGFSVPMARWVRDGRLACDAAGDGVARPDLARRTVAAVRAGRGHWSRAWLLHVLGSEARRGSARG